MDIRSLTKDVRELNIAKGWRTPPNTFAEYIALAHSELSEALEAWRDRRITGALSWTREDGKPMGVGPELADSLIRIIDMCDVFGINLEYEVNRVLAHGWTRPYQHGGRAL